LVVGMDLTDKNTVIEILKRHKLWAKKDFGQNFMLDKEVIGDMVKAAEITEDDIVLEIGPGLGVLTEELIKRAKKVIAVEKDERLLPILKENTLGVQDQTHPKGVFENLEVINEDILRIQVTGKEDSILGNQEYKIVANLPFYISSPIFRKFLEYERRPKSMTVMIQKEVAEKITAEPGDMNILAVSVQFYAKAEIVRLVKKSSFFPKPRVDVAVIKITPYEKPLFDVDTKKFFRIVKAGFGEKRKKLVNSLSGGLQIDKEKIRQIIIDLKLDENTRAEELALTDWNFFYDLL